jgi:hypothetical protein
MEKYLLQISQGIYFPESSGQVVQAEGGEKIIVRNWLLSK